jgi:hypothetical protein
MLDATSSRRRAKKPNRHSSSIQVSGQASGRWPRRAALRKHLKNILWVFTALVVAVACASVWAGSFGPPWRGRTERDRSDVQAPEVPVATWECMHAGSCSDPARYGERRFSYGPSRGYFPQDCKWREVIFEDTSASAYEYWRSDAQQWVSERSKGCTLQVRLPCSASVSAQAPSDTSVDSTWHQVPRHTPGGSWHGNALGHAAPSHAGLRGTRVLCGTLTLYLSPCV